MFVVRRRSFVAAAEASRFSRATPSTVSPSSSPVDVAAVAVAAPHSSVTAGRSRSVDSARMSSTAWSSSSAAKTSRRSRASPSFASFFFFVVSVLVPVRSSRLGVRHVRGSDLAGVLSAFVGRAPRRSARRRVALSVVSVAFSSVAVDARDAVHGSALAVARVVAEVFADVAVARLGVCFGLGLGVELGDDEGEVLAEGIGVDGVIFGVVEANPRATSSFARTETCT